MDGSDVLLSWRPSQQTAYDFSRSFCVDSLNLLDVSQASSCVKHVLDTLHMRRRQGRGLNGPV